MKTIIAAAKKTTVVTCCIVNGKRGHDRLYKEFYSLWIAQVGGELCLRGISFNSKKTFQTLIPTTKESDTAPFEAKQVFSLLTNATRYLSLRRSLNLSAPELIDLRFFNFAIGAGAPTSDGIHLLFGFVVVFSWPNWSPTLTDPSTERRLVDALDRAAAGQMKRLN